MSDYFTNFRFASEGKYGEYIGISRKVGKLVYWD
jgi:hypothetical protein